MGGKLVPAAGRSGKQIDAIATKIIQRYQPHVLESPTPFDIEEFFEFDLEHETQIKSDYQHLPPGIHGITDSEKMESIIDVKLMDSLSQRRFARSTIAHECGHAIIHVSEFRNKKALLRSIQDRDDVSLKMYRKEQIPVYRSPEWQAHRFAGALLLPEKTFVEAYRENGDIYVLADIYEVNPAFVRSRIKALKLK